MGRKLVTIVIDDQHEISSQTISELRRHAEVHTVAGVGDVTALLKVLDVVDVILCDVNMEHDPTPKGGDGGPHGFVLQRTAAADIPVVPHFELLGLNDQASRIDPDPETNQSTPSSKFMPYGPILALPFARFFRNGGVIRPISVFWKDQKLLARGEDHLPGDFTGRINGYVYVALALIWGQTGHPIGGAGGPPDRFGPRFSSMYRSARVGTLADIYREQFRYAVGERRAQLFQNAESIPGLNDLTLEAIEAGGEQVIWDQNLNCESFDLQSIFADYCLDLQDSKMQDKIIGENHNKNIVLNRFNEEMGAHYQNIIYDHVLEFCLKFFALSVENEIPFLEMYDKTRKVLGPDYSADIPPILKIRDLNPVLRRYLVLFAGLLEYGPTKSADRAPKRSVAAQLGIADGMHQHTLADFAYGVRNRDRAIAKSRYTRPFRRGTPEELERDEIDGFGPFDIVTPKSRKNQGGEVVPVSDGDWAWTELDHWMARKFVSRREKDSKETLLLPHGLGRSGGARWE